MSHLWVKSGRILLARFFLAANIFESAISQLAPRSQITAAPAVLIWIHGKGRTYRRGIWRFPKQILNRPNSICENGPLGGYPRCPAVLSLLIARAEIVSNGVRLPPAKLDPQVCVRENRENKKRTTQRAPPLANPGCYFVSPHTDGHSGDQVHGGHHPHEVS